MRCLERSLKADLPAESHASPKPGDDGLKLISLRSLRSRDPSVRRMCYGILRTGLSLFHIRIRSSIPIASCGAFFMRLAQMPISARIARIAMVAVLPWSLLATSCQDSSSSAPDNPEVSAAMTYSEEWKAPDSLSWSLGTGAYRAVNRMEHSTGKTVAFFFLASPGSAKVTVATWTLGMRTALIQYQQDGASLELKAVSKTPDPIANALLAELDSAGVHGRDSLLRRYALHLVQGDSAFRGFPGNCPTGIDTSSLVDLALALAVAKRLPLTDLARTWSLSLDTAGLRARVRSLVAQGLVKPADTLFAFPRYPVRVAVAVSIPALEIGRSVAVQGSFEGDSSLAYYEVKILHGSQDATPAFKVASSVKRMSANQKTWDLRTDAALTISDSTAPVGTYTIVVWVVDSKGRSDTSRADFEVFAKTVKIDEPRIVLRSPSQDAVLPFETATVEARWSVGYAAKIDSVRIGGAKISPTLDSLYARSIDLVPDGIPHAITIQVFTASGVVSDSVSVRRQTPPRVDSTLLVAFATPGRDTIVAHSSTSIAVAIKTISVLHVDSVVVAGIRLARGSDPSIWTGNVSPLEVGGNFLVAKAYAGTRLGVATTSVQRRDIVGTPRFSPEPGSYPSETWVTISDTTLGADLSCSFDDKNWFACEDSILVQVPETLRVRAALAGRDSSRTQAYYAIHDVAPVEFTPAAGRYSSTQSVTLSSRTPGASFECSRDALTWSPCTGPVEVSGSGILYGRASRAGMASSMGGAKYQIVRRIAVPVLSVASGTYAAGLTVSVSDSTPSAAIEWSFDSASWTDYTGPIPVAVSRKLYVRATATDFDTAWASASYAIRTSAPSISPAGGTFQAPPTVSIGSSTPASVALYSFDGTTWLEASTTSPLYVKASGKLYAKAVAPGQDTSEATTVDFTVHDFPKIGAPPTAQTAPINQILSLPLGLRSGMFSPLSVREFRTRTGSWTAFAGDTLRFGVPWNSDGTDTVVVRVFNANGDGDSIRFPIRSWFLDTRDTTYYNRVLLGGNVWMGSDLSYSAGSKGVCKGEDSTKCKLGRVYSGDPSTSTICPSGWKLPAASDWKSLVSAVSGGASSTSLTAEQLKDIQSTGIGGTNKFGLALDSMWMFDAGTGGTHWTYGSGTYLSTTIGTGTCTGHTTCTTLLFEGLFVGGNAGVSTARYGFSFTDVSGGSGFGGGGSSFNKARCIESP